MSMQTDDLFVLNVVRLEQLAFRLQCKGFTSTTAVVVCIEVDSFWKFLADILIPDFDWQSIRDRGEIPIARGSLHREGVVEVVSLLVPDLAPLLKKPPPPGRSHVVVCVDRAASLYEVSPREEPS